MHSIRSPLRYPGGKSRAVDEITTFFPDNLKVLYSPFFGGGSIEIYCASKGIRVYGYDNFSPLVEFWQCLLKDRNKLVNIIKNYYPLTKETFYRLQKQQDEYESIYERGAIFYVLNRSSFSGTTMSGGMSPNHARFTPSSIERIRDFHINNLTVEMVDFNESIKKSDNNFLYLDPPYLIEQKLYGKKGNMHERFNHKQLAETLNNRDNWILSYNNSQEIRSLYKDHTFYYPKWKYGMSNNKESSEILIISKDLKTKQQTLL